MKGCACEPETEWLSGTLLSDSPSFSLLLLETMLTMMQANTTNPLMQPIIILILLLSISDSLDGSVGVWISVHLLDWEPRLTTAGFRTSSPVSFELGYDAVPPGATGVVVVDMLLAESRSELVKIIWSAEAAADTNPSGSFNGRGSRLQQQLLSLLQCYTHNIRTTN